MDVQERDIEDLFYKYGKIRDIELKNNRGTIPFAFIRFEDPRWVLGMVSGKSIHFPLVGYLKFLWYNIISSDWQQGMDGDGHFQVFDH